ncbi:hypothetical protein KY285_012955 [Solanum tuberosum]|nr:hypothetical protein KY285_012955 [Solanum tuberosum]
MACWFDKGGKEFPSGSREAAMIGGPSCFAGDHWWCKERKTVKGRMKRVSGEELVTPGEEVWPPELWCGGLDLWTLEKNERKM